MKKNKMIIAILGCICIFLVVALLIVPAARAGEKTAKFKVISYVTEMEVVPVPDVENHIIGVVERRGVAIYENGETPTYHTRATFDIIQGQEGSFGGYTQFGFADGSTTMAKYQGTYDAMVKGQKLPSLKGAGEYIKGTGRFEGIKGKISFTARYVTPYTKDKTKGDMYLDATSTYTLPKK